MPGASRTSARLSVALAFVLVLAACGGEPSPRPGSTVPETSTAAGPASPTPGASESTAEVLPAPGSDSEVYEPNPEAIVVAIDPGHGGCLDWGVPNGWDNDVDKSEKADTLGIGLALADLLREQGISVVLTRTDDSALAGDHYPRLGCSGPAWRDVDGDGEAGFEATGRIRTRDELQARIDLANLARADLLVSIHVNAMTQDGVEFRIAATQSFYDDETPWGQASQELARATQRGVVTALDRVARYDRQDRGTGAVAYYMVSRQWEDGDTCERPGDTWCKPHRGIQLPAVLTEVGSMSLEAESELLAGDQGRQAIARGLYEAIRAWLAERALAVRYDALLPGGIAGSVPPATPGEGAPFGATALPGDVAASDMVPLKVTNTGWETWPDDLQLLVGWERSDLPYLPAPPTRLVDAGVDVPPLAPGESVVIAVPLAVPDGGRALAWITMAASGRPLTDVGSPALQLAWDGGAG